MDIVWIWTIIIAVALVIEFFTMELISVWFAIGGLLGLILAACGVSLEIQIISAAVVAIACVLGLRRFALKFLFKNSQTKAAEPLVGKKLKLLENCDDENFGTVKLNGVIWSVFSDKFISAGKEVLIVSVNGNKLKVTLADESDANLKTSNEEKTTVETVYNETTEEKPNIIKRKVKPKSED